MNIFWIFSFMFGLALASLISSEETFTALEPAQICALGEDVGVCLGAFEKWHFANGECTTFLYGGCGGNMNQFDSKADCEKFCVGA